MKIVTQFLFSIFVNVTIQKVFPLAKWMDVFSLFLDIEVSNNSFISIAK